MIATARSLLRAKRRPYVVQGAVEAGERPVQVHDRQVADRAGLVDLLQQPDRRAVALGRVAVLVGGEVPDACAEDRQVTHREGSVSDQGLCVLFIRYCIMSH